ncbi:hypothetical protein HDV06_007061 [Boothiomyces sp. JEL0866]|nr:hypothetical protein HDV06_007061 [Boothiomyces sp. JEL0866]
MLELTKGPHKKIIISESQVDIIREEFNIPTCKLDIKPTGQAVIHAKSFKCYQSYFRGDGIYFLLRLKGSQQVKDCPTGARLLEYFKHLGAELDAKILCLKDASKYHLIRNSKLKQERFPSVLVNAVLSPAFEPEPKSYYTQFKYIYEIPNEVEKLKIIVNEAYHKKMKDLTDCDDERTVSSVIRAKRGEIEEHQECAKLFKQLLESLEKQFPNEWIVFTGGNFPLMSLRLE